VFPHQGLEKVNDEFMLGDDWLIAPVLTASPVRKIVFPNGRWKDARGHVFKGPGTKEFNVPLNELPFFERMR
jgi:alpha-glucosidase